MASEKRLIDIGQYKAFLKRYIKELYEVDAPMIAGAVERCLYKLEGQPTADAVEVVRCKDCVFHKKDSRRDFWFCERPRMSPQEVSPKDFCSYGRRKNDHN